MIRACSRCRQTFDPARSGGVCPHCGYSGGISRWGIILLGVAALGAVTVGAALLLGPLRPRGDAPDQRPPAPEIADSEFPEAGASIRPPRDWRYLQRDTTSIAFSQVFGAAALRFRVAEPATGRDAHLARIREIVPGAEIVEHAIPEWPGAEALAVKLPGDTRIGASWLLPRGAKALHVIYWGDEGHLAEVKEFREGLRFHDEPPGK
ncbi:MAG: hypothetical protein AAB074_18895 [Planctomycetota bacterium]